jgi:O-antigen ligase
LTGFMERASWPSFFLFPALVCALLTSILASYFYYWLGISCLLLFLGLNQGEKFLWSKLSIAVIAFSSVIVTNLFFIDVAYTSEDFYYPAFFIIGFVVFNQLTPAQLLYLYKLLVYILIVLSMWAFLQYFQDDFVLVGNSGRPNSIFYTANTFSAAINLALLPLIAINLSDRNKPLVFTAMLLFFYVLLLTRSRGGYLSFIFAFGLMFLVDMTYKRKHKLNWLKVISGLIFVFLCFIMIDTYKRGGDFDISSSTRMRGINKQSPRLILYDVAWQLIKEKPVLGHGYNNFQYYWIRDQRAPFRNHQTKFVHNDYLQIWMETGLFGLIGIIGIIVIFYYQVFRRHKHINSNDVSIILGLTGGLSAYFAHALVDFVMYPCFLVLIFSAYLGFSNRILFSENSDLLFFNRIRNKALAINLNKKFWKFFICALLILFFSQPYLAEEVFNHAQKYTKQGLIKKALPYYELARRITPYNADYFMKEGVFWRNIVTNSNNAEWAAERANTLFAAGAKANPFDVMNLLSQAILNRDYADLISSPADNDEILARFDHVLYWWPQLVIAQIEHVKTLSKIGDTKLVKEMLEKYFAMNPDSNELAQLEKELAL